MVHSFDFKNLPNVPSQPITHLNDHLLQLIPSVFLTHSDGIPDDNVRLQVIRNVLRFLPRSNYFILKKLCGFLHSVHANSSVNKMDASNLAIVFAPNILRPPPMYCNVLQMQLSEARFATSLTQSLISEYEFFFGAEDVKPKLEAQKTPTPPPNKPKRSTSNETNNKTISVLSSSASPQSPSNSSVVISSDGSSTEDVMPPNDTPTTVNIIQQQSSLSGLKKPPIPSKTKPSPSVFIPSQNGGSNGNNVNESSPKQQNTRWMSPKPPPNGLKDSSRSVFVASANHNGSSRSDTNVRSVIENMNTLHTSKQATAEIKRLSRVMKAGDICLDDQSLKSTTLSSFNNDTAQNKRLPVPPRKITVFTEATAKQPSTTQTTKNEMFAIPPRTVSPRKTTVTNSVATTATTTTIKSQPTKPPTPSRFAGAYSSTKPPVGSSSSQTSTPTTTTSTVTPPKPLPPPKSSSSSSATGSRHQNESPVLPPRRSLDEEKKFPGNSLKNNPFIKQDVSSSATTSSSSGATRAPPPLPRKKQ